jgi:hypothetical protein
MPTLNIVTRHHIVIASSKLDEKEIILAYPYVGGRELNVLACHDDLQSISHPTSPLLVVQRYYCICGAQQGAVVAAQKYPFEFTFTGH